jgi:tetratricopeptide (TPR) repeat protein
MRLPALAIPILLLSLSPGQAAAAVQDSAPASWNGDSPSVETAEALHFKMRPIDALEELDQVLDISPTDYEALWRAARESVTLGMLSANPEDARTYYDRAEEYARRAVDAREDGLEGRHFLAVSLGRQALSEGIRTRIGLAQEVRHQAEQVVEADESYAGAHHLLGRWHAEVKRLGRVERFVAQKLLGGDGFQDASWEEAESHMRRAVELEPSTIMHHLELGRILVDLDRYEEAKEAFRTVLELPVREPFDPQQQQEAQELLKELGGN